MAISIFRMIRSRPAGGAFLAALLAVAAVASHPADARDRYARYPAVAVAPDLAKDWILQLSPGSGVVPGYRRPHLDRPAQRAYDGAVLQGASPAARQPRRAVRADQSGRVPGVRAYDGTTGSTVSNRQGQAAAKPKREMKRVDTIDPMFLPQTVDYATKHAPGTVVIDTRSKFLYRVEDGGKARRYGVGVGKPGFAWAGTHKVTQKKEWPAWTPPPQMRAREKKKGKILPARMDGGPANPLGARAMYLGSTLYRIHGTNQPWTIGKALSSGCIRMRNEDVMELYESVPVGTRVVVL